MKTESMRWRRLDVPGEDECTLCSLSDGWRLDGEASFELESEPAELHYSVLCGPDFHARRATVHGTIAARRVEFVIERRAEGWLLDGKNVRAIADCIDVDLGFTPATNLLPVRRLALAENQSANAPAAWLDVARGTLERLPQSYQNRGAGKYWYEAPTVGYAALLEVDRSGFVVDYPGLWTSISKDVST
jgi:hypothetical protein